MNIKSWLKKNKKLLLQSFGIAIIIQIILILLSPFDIGFGLVGLLLYLLIPFLYFLTIIFIEVGPKWLKAFFQSTFEVLMINFEIGAWILFGLLYLANVVLMMLVIFGIGKIIERLRKK